MTNEELENFPVKLGEVVALRTLGFHYIGIVSRISQAGQMYFLHLEDAFVIADSGDWDKALKTGKITTGAKLGQETRISLHSAIEVAPWFKKIPG